MEAPFSIPISDPLTLAVRLHPKLDKKHHFTSRIWEQQVGDTFYVRGPYGKPFKCTSHEYYLIGGGTGIASLVSISDVHDKNFVFLGAKTESELIFRNRFRGLTIFATEEESSAETRGYVTNAFDSFFYQRRNCFGKIIACGPLPMLNEVVKVAEQKGFADSDVHLIMEPYMKCGVGICGCCSFEDGSVSCVDGHIITADRFREFYQKGKMKRNACGGWEP
jgi:dihydroorotate dehydrogenase electron transfer subunit